MSDWCVLRNWYIPIWWKKRVNDQFFEMQIKAQVKCDMKTAETLKAGHFFLLWRQKAEGEAESFRILLISSQIIVLLFPQHLPFIFLPNLFSTEWPPSRQHHLAACSRNPSSLVFQNIQLMGAIHGIEATWAFCPRGLGKDFSLLSPKKKM